jgi:hypothetical protein
MSARGPLSTATRPRSASSTVSLGGRETFPVGAHSTPVNDAFSAIAPQHGGVIMRADALVAGFTAAEIERRRRTGEWVPIRRGAYVERRMWEAMAPVQRHVAVVYAVVRRLDLPAAVSHQSAVARYDLPTWGLDLSLVHVTRGDLHSPRLEGGVHHHAGQLPQEDVSVVDGIVVTAPARTAIDTARVTSFEPSVVVADAILHRGLIDRVTMLERLDRMRDWPGTCNAGRVLEFADGLAESVGESRCRVLFHELGFPAPVLQKVIVLPIGEVTRVDFFFEEFDTVGEFDGQVKYGRFLRTGETPGEVVWREKRREDHLRELGYERHLMRSVCRVIWAELSQPSVVAERFRTAFARAARRRAVLV